MFMVVSRLPGPIPAAVAASPTKPVRKSTALPKRGNHIGEVIALDREPLAVLATLNLFTETDEVVHSESYLSDWNSSRSLLVV